MICDVKMWEDLWKLGAKYDGKISQDDAAAWEQIVRDIEEIRLRYNSTLCNCILMAILDDIESESRKAAGKPPKHEDVRLAMFYKNLIYGRYDA